MMRAGTWVVLQQACTQSDCAQVPAIVRVIIVLLGLVLLVAAVGIAQMMYEMMHEAWRGTFGTLFDAIFYGMMMILVPAVAGCLGVMLLSLGLGWLS